MGSYPAPGDLEIILLAFHQLYFDSKASAVVFIGKAILVVDLVAGISILL